MLAIVLDRLEGGKKKRSPVVFPEELTCMRSGRYTLSSVLLHSGDSGRDGHFFSICSLGTGAYVRCDDHELRDLTWPDVATPDTWQDAYVLLYTRMGAEPSPSTTRSSVSRDPLPRASVDADVSAVPQFPRMTKEASENARRVKVDVAERRREEARKRGIGNLTGGCKTATTQLARDAVAAMQRQRVRQDSHALALRALRNQYGESRVDGFLLAMGDAAAAVDLTVLEDVLAADLAHSLEEEVAKKLPSADDQPSGSTRWQSLLDHLPDVVREGLLLVLRAEYKDDCATILSQPWSWDWVGWNSRRPDGSPARDREVGLYQAFDSHRNHEEGEVSTPFLFAVHDFVRRHVRHAHSHSAVKHITDEQKVAALRRQGLSVGVGKVWGANNCLADSLLQLMQEHKVVASCPEHQRAAACVALWKNS